jgi:predicted transcriptional regulator
MSAVTFELPEELVARVRRVAAEQDLSFEDALADAVSRWVAASEEREYLRARAERGRKVDIKAVLSNSPDVEPDESDRIE